MTALRIVVAALGLALLGVIAWAIGQTSTPQDFWFENLALLDQPWGMASVANLLVGLALTAVVMMLSERSFIAGALWAAPILVLGNIWTAVWLVLRLPQLADRLTRPDWPTD
ncbi:MAG: hypothetical protein AB7M12_03730 [Hyphomonadaceae bacterium]